MLPEFKTAIEAQQVADSLRKQLKTLNYNPDLKKMLFNIEGMINEFSIVEVKARQNKTPRMSDTQRQKLLEAMDTMDKLIFLARICQ